jgi:hypothetical protein
VEDYISSDDRFIHPNEGAGHDLFAIVCAHAGRRIIQVQFGKALCRWTDVWDWRSFKFGLDDMCVCDDGTRTSWSDAYAGRRDDGGFLDNSGDIRFTRVELWTL